MAGGPVTHSCASIFSISVDSRFSRLRTEINNGRLAMLGIMAFLAESKVPGSVPALNGLGIAPYSGEVPSGGSIARPQGVHYGVVEKTLHCK